MIYKCNCGHTFPEDLGKYGCPNCEGEYKAKLMTKENRGGKREGSGRNYKYGEPTETLTFRVPKSRVSEIKEKVKNWLNSHTKSHTK